jgi:hypothetical protein
MVFCRKCGATLHDEAVVCVKCGVPTDVSKKAESSVALVFFGYICALLSLLVLPPAFGLAGLIIGIINLTRGRIGHGIAQIVLSVTFAIFGMLIGIALNSR